MTVALAQLTIAQAGSDLRSGRYTARDLVESALSEAKRLNPEINAFAEIFDDALDEADTADKLIREGNIGPLTGIPLAIKDNILIKGKRSTSGSKILANHRGTYDATVVAKLRSAGAIIVGRTNMDEFAMGSSSETCAWGPVRNPIDPTRVPGGSSGGSAAAVAMGSVLGSLGSDTGGSIRQPAALCGIVGLKPTYGRVSRYGLMALASSLDQIGPFAKTVDDAELLFHGIEGYDPMDATSVPDILETAAHRKQQTLTIGVPEKFIAMEGIDPDVRENFRATIAMLKEAGHLVKTVDLPTLPLALAVYYVLQPAEASSNLARYDGIRYGFRADAGTLFDVYQKTRGEGFGKEVRRRILLGTYVLSAGYYDAYYNQANAVRRLITKELTSIFKEIDVLATPTAPSPAFELGEKTTDPLKMYLEDIFTVSANISGVPGISVPSGWVERKGKKLPVGIQFMADHFAESVLFAAGREVERLRS